MDGPLPSFALERQPSSTDLRQPSLASQMSDENIISKVGDAKHSMERVKGVILIGGPNQGTRFRPLSLKCPKPLFPVAGKPIVYHHIKALAAVPNMSEVILIGVFPESDLADFIVAARREFKIPVRYLREHISLGTAGGLYHFRDFILRGNPNAFIVLHADICADLPLNDLLGFHASHGNAHHATILSVKAKKDQAHNYGCIVADDSGLVQHYVEKPSSFISNDISCGVYVLSPKVLDDIQTAFLASLDQDADFGHNISFERDIIPTLAQDARLFVFKSACFWSQIKTAASAIYASRHYLSTYRETSPKLLAQKSKEGPVIVGDVFVHETAEVSASAKLGPNVTIGPGVRVGPGARVRDSILLDNVEVHAHACVINAVIGWNSTVGEWARVEGFAVGVDPNNPTTQIDSVPLFNTQGRLEPSITIVGDSCSVAPEIMLLNSLVLPFKDITVSHKNEIIL